MKSISKEIFIMALLIMIVVFVVGIIFYDYMPNNKTVPEPVTYQADTSTTTVLQDIAASSTVSSNGSETSTESQRIIKSYSIGPKELSTAASKQTYTSGKTDPFAEYQGPTTTNNGQNGNTTSTNTTAGQSTNPTAAPNTANTGTFFESSNSK